MSDAVLPELAAPGWSGEARAAVTTMALVTVVGAPAGLVWAAWHPSFDVARALLEETRFQVALAVDVRLGVVLALTGALVGMATWIFARSHGAGVAIGLVLGGLLAAWIASRVGAQAVHPEHLRQQVTYAFQRNGLPELSQFKPDAQSSFLADARFRLRSPALLLVLPLVASLSFALLSTLRDRSSLGRVSSSL